MQGVEDHRLLESLLADEGLERAATISWPRGVRWTVCWKNTSGPGSAARSAGSASKRGNPSGASASSNRVGRGVAHQRPAGAADGVLQPPVVGVVDLEPRRHQHHHRPRAGGGGLGGDRLDAVARDPQALGDPRRGAGGVRLQRRLPAARRVRGVGR